MKKKILIVEDEKPMARALELKLTRAGYDAASANDGESGLAYLEKNKVDLILLDLIMPRMDGFAVLEHLRKKGNKTPVVVLSNLSQEDDQKRCTALGAKDFCIKSNTGISEIVDKVKDYLAKKK
jgi:DNA-binding response OmpR family regulator